MRFSRAMTNDFAVFSNALIRSGDIDPQFWLLKEYYRRHKFSKNKALWWSLVYLAFYHLGSALTVLERFPEPTLIKKKDWQTGLIFTHQRRLFRGSENYFALEHLNTVITLSGGDLEYWMGQQVRKMKNPLEAWTNVRTTFEALPYAGPWSSYKWCDITKFIHDYPISAPDIGTKPGATAGPIAGLSSLTGLTWKECSDPELPNELSDYLIKEFGVPYNGLDQLESCLCDWQSVLKGKYYVGHDIDRDQGQIEDSPMKAELHGIRKDLFDHRYLGELQNWPRWVGVRKHLNTAYYSSGRVVNNFPDIKEPFK